MPASHAHSLTLPAYVPVMLYIFGIRTPYSIMFLSFPAEPDPIGNVGRALLGSLSQSQVAYYSVFSVLLISTSAFAAGLTLGIFSLVSKPGGTLGRIPILGLTNLVVQHKVADNAVKSATRLWRACRARAGRHPRLKHCLHLLYYFRRT